MKESQVYFVFFIILPLTLVVYLCEIGTIDCMLNFFFFNAGYRDDSLESVKRNQEEYNLPLTVLSYKDLYGWTMDDIVKQVGRKNNCTFCGVFRRQALERGAILLNCDVIATGHNADDVAETILMNLLRGDIARLQRCTSHITVIILELYLCFPKPIRCSDHFFPGQNSIGFSPFLCVQIQAYISCFTESFLCSSSKTTFDYVW